MADLLRISNCEKADRVADVVFVHGLDGDARATWHPKDQPGAFWPAWLGEEFPSLGVWSLGYQVAASAWKGHSMPLVDRATNTLDLLELDEIGRRPVAFICHSLGGLLIKQVLRLASDSNKPAYKALAERTKLVVFLSTPHSGADMASWIAYIGKLLRTTVGVEELEAHHPRLLELNKWYRDHAAEMGIETFVYCEKLPTSGVLVVNQTTADPGIPGVDVVPLDEDHVSICKLSEKNQVYRRVKRLLTDIVMKAESPAPAVSRKETGTANSEATIVSGKRFGRAKIEICDRLIGDWHRLADYLEISPADRARFERGQEPHGIWEWLLAHNRFGELADAFVFIGREDLVPLLPDRPRCPPHVPAPGAAGLADTASTMAEDRYRRQRIERWSQPRHALDRRFVRLTLLIDQGEEAQGPRWRESTQFQDLHEVLAEVQEPATVLVGPPGSGKSTLLRHHELECCRAVAEGTAESREERPLTFFIELNDYKPEDADRPLPPAMDWLAARWKAIDPALPPLPTLLREGRLTLLLDAINEIPYAKDAAIRQWKGFLRELARDYPGNRVIFSCRSLDYYSASLSSKELPVPQVRLEALSDPHVQEFLERYDPAHGPALWATLKASPQLDLFRLPYYLKLLVEQATDGHVPSGRAALFTGIVRRSLKREVDGENALFQAGELVDERDIRRLAPAAVRWKTPFDLPERGVFLPGLGRLAFKMQAKRTATEAGQVRIAYDEAIAYLDHPRAGDLLEAGAALGVLDLDLGSEEVLYVHQLMQEYFAARRLAKKPYPALVAQAWRADEVSPSLAETLERLADSDPLPPLPAGGWAETTLMAAAMAADPDRFVADLMTHNLPLAGRCAAQPDVGASPGLKDRLRWDLVARTRAPEADLRARIAAGLALGELGDPRFERRRGPCGDYLLPPLIPIPAGTDTLGSEEGDADERPVHRVELAAFRIGRFPVTNAEWALFMSAGGYEDERFWETDEARAWRRGESTAEGPKQQWREHRKRIQQAYAELHTLPGYTSQQVEISRRFAEMTDTEFEAQLDTSFPPGRRTEPQWWRDATFNNPGQPVVGVSWHEARAYCAWLCTQAGEPYALPTEAQWEAAARGLSGRRYAYGKDCDAALCNTFETHIRRTTPIGVFPGGDTPEGLVDMSGNTWDWTSTLYRPYPCDVGDGRDDAMEAGPRVVRGGSWANNQDSARAACRDSNDPVVRDRNLGLRVVCSSPIG